ncbi:MAG: hypothetical protein L0H63_03255, partial [Nitrococcus sp.]|nr:hypothetical protein [Nitrococcus sp.]
MTRSRYLFVYIISLSLIIACGVCYGKSRGTIQLTVVDAATDTDLRRLQTGQMLNMSKRGSSLTLRANPRVKGHRSVVFVLDGKHYQTDNLVPYAMAGGSRKNYKAWDLEPGAHTLIVHVYNRHGGKGKRLASRTVSFSLVGGKAGVEVGDMAASEFSDKVAPKAGGGGGTIQLTVVDAAKDTDLSGLQTGQQLNVSQLGSSLTLRANPRVNGDKSVVFVLDGKPYQTDNLAPYAMAGGSRNDYKAWDLELGAHTLIVHVFNRNGGKGKRLASRTVSFSLVGDKAGVEVGDKAGVEVGDMAASEVGGKEAACNLQQRIKQASPGDVIDGRGCVERSALELRKRLTLKNLTIKGSDDWSGDFSKAGGNYRSSRNVPKLEE